MPLFCFWNYMTLVFRKITAEKDDVIIEVKCWICNILIHYSLLLITSQKS